MLLLSQSKFLSKVKKKSLEIQKKKIPSVLLIVQLLCWVVTVGVAFMATSSVNDVIAI